VKPRDLVMTILQRCMPKEVQEEAYARVPITCNLVREILDEAGRKLMQDLSIAPEEYATVEAALNRAFIRIREEVTQVLRDEQMTLLHRSHE